MDNSANNNLIQFPGSAIKRYNAVPLSKNKESVEATQRDLLTQMVDFHAHHLLQILALDGIDVESDDFDKYFALSIECLRATIFNTLDLDHPMLPFLKDMIIHVDKMRKEEEKTE